VFLIIFFSNVEPTNETVVSEFLLMGLPDDPELEPLLFSLFLSTSSHHSGKPDHHPGCECSLPSPHSCVLLFL
jgi:hypothetical protein